MGVYPVHCPECKLPNYWYSGNTVDQRCPLCRSAKKENLPMAGTPDQHMIEALKVTIAVQKDLITHLKAEVERLKTAQIYIGSPSAPPYPQPGGTQPWPLGYPIDYP